jgi:hypothetical protein
VFSVYKTAISNHVPCGIRFAVIKTFIYMYELFFFTEFVEFQVRTY